MNIEKIKHIKSSKPMAKADVIMFVGAVVLSIAIMLGMLFASGTGAYVEINNNGDIKTYALNVDQTITVKPDYIVKIQGGEVWVEHTDCAGQDCKRLGKISSPSQIIVCSPHNIIIRVLNTRPSGIVWDSGA